MSKSVFNHNQQEDLLQSPETCDISTIITEIQKHKEAAETHFIEIGKLLNEAKGKEDHGKWPSWLRDNVEISAITARRYMRLAAAFDQGSPVTAYEVA